MCVQDITEKKHRKLLASNRHLRYMWFPYTDTVVVVTNNPIAEVRASSCRPLDSAGHLCCHPQIAPSDLAALIMRWHPPLKRPALRTVLKLQPQLLSSKSCQSRRRTDVLVWRPVPCRVRSLPR